MSICRSKFISAGLVVTLATSMGCTDEAGTSGDAGAIDPHRDGGIGASAGNGTGALPGDQPPDPDYWPTDGWRHRAPDEVGMDAERLDEAVAFALQSNTEGLAIIQDGYIVSETYDRGFSEDQRHESFSVAKSVTSGLIGIAIDQEAIPDTDARVCDYYDAWDCDDGEDLRSSITIAHLLGLTSGLDWNEDWGEGASFLNNDAIQMSTSSRPIDYVLDKPGLHEPGEHFQYSTGDPALLSGILQEATGQTALAFGQQHVFEPIGAESIQWQEDAAGHTTTFANMQAALHDYARYGFLYLHRGRWDGEQLVPASWVDLSTRPGETLVDWYNHLWHVNLPERFEDPDLPADGYSAMGVQGQFVTVVPSENLMIVRLADDPMLGAEFDMGGLLRRVLAAKR